MAQDVKIKIYDNGWIEVHSKTNIDQITDLTPAAKAILSLTQNAGAETFIKVHTDGQVSLIPKASMPTEIGAAPDVHNHTIAQIDNLQGALDAKADISGGKILSTQIPGYLIGGMKKAENYEVNDASIILNEAFRTSHGMDNSGTTDGKYIIITNVNGCDVTLGAGHILTIGDEGQTTGTVHLEEGDWIIFRGYNSPNYEFDVLNNKYRVASVTDRGVGKLSPGTVTSRAGLASSSNSDKIIDEYALSKVMKGIYYIDDATTITNPKQGDLVIEY